MSAARSEYAAPDKEPKRGEIAVRMTRTYFTPVLRIPYPLSAGQAQTFMGHFVGTRVIRRHQLHLFIDDNATRR
jgi:hypothetical protein